MTLDLTPPTEPTEEDKQSFLELLDRLKQHCRLALDCERSTAPANRTLVQSTINSIYQREGLEPPLVIWCQSPLQTTLMPIVLEFLFESPSLWQFRKHLTQSFEGTPLLAKLWEQLMIAIDGALDHQDESVENKLLFASDNQAFQAIGESLVGGRNLVSRLLTVKFSGDLFKQHAELLHGEFADSAHAAFDEAFRNLVDSSIPYHLFPVIRALAKELGPEFIERIPHQDQLAMGTTWSPNIMFEVFSCTMIDFGLWWGFLFEPWLPLYDFMHSQASESPLSENLLKIFGLPCNSCADWALLAREAYCYAFFPNVVFVSERPIKSAKDSSGKLQGEGGPALVFADGFELTPVVRV